VTLPFTPGGVEKRLQLTTGSGLEYVPRIALSRVEALGVLKENFPVLCHTLPASATVDGVLGLDFFIGRRLTIDLSVGTVETA
jgi:hypothetical protein